jgi:4a-hydroxytetrahydrobiopterin dehydratase
MSRKKLSEQELNNALNELPGWEVKDGKLYKQFKFSNFADAIGWLVKVSFHADKMDHHPEWTNVYNRVQVSLVTHDLGNMISTWDVELAKKMDAAVN